MQAFARFLGILRNGPVPRHENVGRKRIDRIERPQPAQAIAVVNKEKLIGEKQLAHIDDAVLRHEYNAVAARVTSTQMKNLNFLAAEMNRQAIAKSHVWKPGLLIFRRGA